MRSGMMRCVLGVLTFYLLVGTHAAADSEIYAASPSQGTTTSPPLVMLVMSQDHELFKKGYSDNSDIDGDGIIDKEYKDSIDYSGYFQSQWCYQYNGNQYEPVQQGKGANGHHCESALAPWSGNFLNWVMMTRMDFLRLIFYGGKRVTDSTTDTVLQRAGLSSELDAFVKVYSGSDVNKYTPYNDPVSFCSLGGHTGPIVRIAKGKYPGWATTEVTQCQWGNAFSPNVSDRLAEHNARIRICVSGRDADTSERCKRYPSGNYKPVGILQNYGEEGQIRFGLISGSVFNPRQGGVLRRNISRIGGNQDSSQDEIDLNTGVFNSSLRGIIYHMSTFRLVSGYDGFGNPVAELYLEALRYFAGQQPTTAFASNDSSLGLYEEAWRSPLGVSNSCASCSILLISSATPSYDGDGLDSASGLPDLSGLSGVLSNTDTVGNIEYNNQFAGDYFYGGNDRICTPKYLSRLSDARGICPDAPNIDGSFLVSGLAYYGRNADLRSDLIGAQNITTYGIQIAENIPSLSVSVGGGTVSFSPISTRGFNKGMTVDELSVDGRKGKFTFIWEVCQYGCDNDLDFKSSIAYCVGNTCSPSINDNQIKITSRFEYRFAGGASPQFSHSVFGTTSDGIASPYAVGPIPGAGLQEGQGTPKSTIYTVAPGSNNAVLPIPLYLAAKYGSFNDLDNDGTPNHDTNGDGTPDDDSREWDNRNNLTGSLGADGIPDNYFFANNPARLEKQLAQIMKDIASRISSGSSAALVSNSASGVGMAIQALFRPKTEINNKEISWVGLMHSLFVDARGHLREDSNGNKALDGYDIDRVVNLFFDPATSQTVVQRYTSNTGGENLEAIDGTVDLNELKPIWDAREALMQVNDVVTQRAYDRSADSGRHIFTWLDTNEDGNLDPGEDQPFVPNTFTGVNAGYLGVDDSEVTPLVNYIRGQDQPGYRTRSVDYDGDGDQEVWRLGDIIHSNPVSVASPKGFYTENKSFNPNDATFIEFQKHYKNRRQMVYVGSNSGLIHAFNSGFWDEDNDRFLLSKDGGVSHPLGSEVWAYAPMNLLPHLRWLTEQNYPHVYYMDGEPLIFDANIFPEGPEYPRGWGTVLVMGMRQGGGPIDVAINGSTRTRRSAYVVMDITNPENPPRLLAEISHPELGFTTMKPVVIQRRKQNESGDYDKPKENNWYLAFGSGPKGAGTTGIREALDYATSNQNLKVFIYDLKNRAFLSRFSPFDTGIPNAYAGDMSVVDWDQDYYDDAVYFGSVSSSGSQCVDVSVMNTSFSRFSSIADAGFSSSVTGGGSISLSNNSAYLFSESRQDNTINLEPQESLSHITSEPFSVEAGETLIFDYNGALEEDHQSFTPYIGYEVLDSNFSVVYSRQLASGATMTTGNTSESYTFGSGGTFRVRFFARSNIGDGGGSYSWAKLFVQRVYIQAADGTLAIRRSCSGMSGQLLRINLDEPSSNSWQVSTLLDIGRPVTARPVAVANSDNERWVFAGTGRELNRLDSRSTDQEYFFGLKEPWASGEFTYDEVAVNSLVDTTDIDVRANGDFTRGFSIRAGETVGNFNALLNAMKGKSGWINRLEHNGVDPSSKSISSAVNIFSLILLTEYKPPADQCQVDGTSFLRAQHYQTGTAIPANIQRVLTAGDITDFSISTKRISLGTGLAPAPAVYQNSEGNTSVIVQGGGGNISSTSLDYQLSDSDGKRQSWRQIHNIPK